MSYDDDDYGYWDFPDCAVQETAYDKDLHTFDVYTVDENGIKYVHTVYPSDILDMEKCINALNEGDSPATIGWDDGLGNTVRIGSGKMLTFWIVTTIDGKDYKIELPDVGEDDIWRCIEVYDDLNGTNVWDIVTDFYIPEGYKELSYCDDISFCPKFKQNEKGEE